MKEYTAPKLEVVTFKISDVITVSSLPTKMQLNIADLGSGSLSSYLIP